MCSTTLQHASSRLGNIHPKQTSRHFQHGSQCKWATFSEGIAVLPAAAINFNDRKTVTPLIPPLAQLVLSYSHVHGIILCQLSLWHKSRQLVLQLDSLFTPIKREPSISGTHQGRHRYFPTNTLGSKQKERSQSVHERHIKHLQSHSGGNSKWRHVHTLLHQFWDRRSKRITSGTISLHSYGFSNNNRNKDMVWKVQ